MNAYYIAEGDEVTGPFLRDQVQAMWNAGQITAAAQWCYEGSEDWQSIRTLMNAPEPFVKGKHQAEESDIARMANMVAAQGEYNRKRFSPGMAFLYGFLWPFGGFMYTGTMLEAFIALILSFVTIGLCFIGFGIPIWIIAMILAPSSATSANRRLARRLRL